MGQRGPGAKPATARPRLIGAQPRPTHRHARLTRAEAVATFLQGLMITTGSAAGSKLVLRGWQRQAVDRLYATGPTGHRLVRTALLSMGRKAGKSVFAAALALCHLCGPEARRRGQIVSAAADRAQARIIFSEVKAFILANADLAARTVIREWNSSIEDTITGSTFTALSADARKAHGLSPTVAICDELSQWRSRELLDALRTGSGAWAEPLLMVISTRSPDPNSPLEELIRFADEAADDPTFLGLVHSAPPDLDPFSLEAWQAANPDMDAIRLADIEALATQARRLPSTMPAFEAYCLNRPVAVDDRFISAIDWDACNGTADATGPCFAALDLAGGNNDLTAAAIYWPESRLLRCWAFLPCARIDAAERSDRAPYRQWEAAGHIVTCPGGAIDRAWLGYWLAEQTQGLELISLASDRWMLADLTATWDREGINLPLTPMGQGYRDLSPCVSSFERLVLDGRLRHGGNPLLRWAIANVAIETDAAANRKPSKLRSRGRIDPAVASIMAVGLAERQPAPPSFEFTGMFA